MSFAEDGWDGLEQAGQFQIAPETDDARPDVDQLYLALFSSPTGRQVLAHLRQVTIEQPSWVPGADASYGFVREGQNSMVRDIENRMRRAMNHE